MAGYLLDTSVLIALVDPKSPHHQAAHRAISLMSPSDLQFVSAISIGEISTGVAGIQRVHGKTPMHAHQVLAEAQARSLLNITGQVGECFGVLKAAMAARFMPNSKRKAPYLEDWIVDVATGKRLGINENDLWICAQGYERDLNVLSCDKDFERVQEAEPRFKVQIIRAS
ncbi:MAG: type II toxin-antitoxin system VapC family toxin [Alkalilacustris sp.]